MTERFPIQSDRRLYIVMVLVGLCVAILSTYRAQQAGRFWPLPMLLALDAVLIGYSLWNVVRPNAAVLVTENGIELLRGATVGKRDEWRVKWNEIRSIAQIKGVFGEQLQIRTDSEVREIVLRLPFPGWRLEGQETLFSSLAAHGVPPRPPTEPGADDLRVFSYRGEFGPWSTRAVVGWLIGVALFFVALELLTHRADRIPGQLLVVLLFGYGFLFASRIKCHAKTSRTSISFTMVQPIGFLAAFRLRPRLKEKDVWTIGWSELRRVRLGSVAGEGPDLMLELETPDVKRRLIYEGEKFGFESPESLRTLFLERGFPVELVLFPDPSDAEAAIVTERGPQAKST